MRKNLLPILSSPLYSRARVLLGLGGVLLALASCRTPRDPDYDEYWLVPDQVYVEYNGAAQDTRWGGRHQRGSIHGGTIGFAWAITKPER